jgi:ferredoxin
VTYVIAEPCIGEKNGACVDVCPAACIHTTPDAPQNYIDPDICIECEQCVLVCPVHAVFLDKEMPDEWQAYIDINAGFFRRNKPAQQIGLERATKMAEAIREYAARSGMPIAAVILDGQGQRLAFVCLDGVDEAALEPAEKKAYTALSYGVATHELRPDSKPLWLSPADIDQQRVLFVGGGFPIVAGADTIGAVGVAGGANAAQDILCCQAALGTLQDLRA